MRTALLLTFGLLFTTLCSAQQRDYMALGEQDSVAVSYRWNERKNKPTELWLKLENTSTVRREVHARLDLLSEGVIVEQFQADTVMAPGRTFTGKLNGFYFIPQALKPEQLRDAGTSIELTELRTPEVTRE